MRSKTMTSDRYRFSFDAKVDFRREGFSGNRKETQGLRFIGGSVEAKNMSVLVVSFSPSIMLRDWRQKNLKANKRAIPNLVRRSATPSFAVGLDDFFLPSVWWIEWTKKCLIFPFVRDREIPARQKKNRPPANQTRIYHMEDFLCSDCFLSLSVLGKSQKDVHTPAMEHKDLILPETKEKVFFRAGKSKHPSFVHSPAGYRVTLEFREARKEREGN